MKEAQESRLFDASLKGRLESGGTVETEELFLDSTGVSGGMSSTQITMEWVPRRPIVISHRISTTESQVKFAYDLANLVVAGTEWTGTATQRMLNRIRMRVDNRDIQIDMKDAYSNAQALVKNSPGKIRPTAHASLIGGLAETESVRNMIYDLCVLASFATGSWVAPFVEECQDAQGLVRTTLLPAKRLPFHEADPVIEVRLGTDLKSFLENSYPLYTERKGILGINVVVEYYVNAKLISYLELKFLIASIGLECLKSHLSDYFRTKSKSVDLSSFRSALTELYSDLGMPYNPSELDFVTVRDKVVHTGRFPSNVNPVQEFRELINLYDRTLLTILGYRGKPYLNVVKDYASELLP